MNRNSHGFVSVVSNRNITRLWALLMLATVSTGVCALEISGAVNACHDPSGIIEHEGRFYILSTAPNINVRSSADLITWRWEPRVFDYASGMPPWMDDIASGDNLWAPDVIRNAQGNYLLFYSRNLYPTPETERTVCGVASASAITGPFTDGGPILNLDLYHPGYRVIDPALLFDTQGRLWLAVGSFGAPNADGYNVGGIRVFELDETTGHLVTPGENGTRIAGPWIEAPYLLFRNGYYYLFFNEGRCCEGLRSTYYVRMGRATQVQGPYVDMEGTSLLPPASGGTLFMGLDFPDNYTGATTNATPRPHIGDIGRELAPGHVAATFLSDGIERVTYFFYDAATSNGEPTLGLRTLLWGPDDWPRPGFMLTDGVYAIGVSNAAAQTPSRPLYLQMEGDTPRLRPFSGSLTQYFDVVRVAPNRYRISPHGESSFLHETSGRVARDVVTPQTNATRWFLQQTGDMAFQWRHPDTDIRVFVESDTIGSPLEAATDPAVDALQHFFFTPVGAYRLCSQYSQMCAEPQQTVPGAPVRQRIRSDDGGQYWWFVPTPDGYTKLIHVESGLAMVVASASTINPTPVVLEAAGPGDHQEWALDVLTDGSLRLMPKISGTALEVADASLTEDAPMRQNRWTHVRHQQFAIEWIPSLAGTGPGHPATEDPIDTDASDPPDTGMVDTDTPGADTLDPSDTGVDTGIGGGPGDTSMSQTDADDEDRPDNGEDTDLSQEASGSEAGTDSGCGCHVSGNGRGSGLLGFLLSLFF